MKIFVKLGESFFLLVNFIYENLTSQLAQITELMHGLDSCLSMTAEEKNVLNLEPEKLIDRVKEHYRKEATAIWDLF